MGLLLLKNIKGTLLGFSKWIKPTMVLTGTTMKKWESICSQSLKTLKSHSRWLNFHILDPLYVYFVFIFSTLYVLTLLECQCHLKDLGCSTVYIELLFILHALFLIESKSIANRVFKLSANEIVYNFFFSACIS